MEEPIILAKLQRLRFDLALRLDPKVRPLLVKKLLEATEVTNLGSGA